MFYFFFLFKQTVGELLGIQVSVSVTIFGLGTVVVFVTVWLVDRRRNRLAEDSTLAGMEGQTMPMLVPPGPDDTLDISDIRPEDPAVVQAPAQQVQAQVHHAQV